MVSKTQAFKLHSSNKKTWGPDREVAPPAPSHFSPPFRFFGPQPTYFENEEYLAEAKGGRLEPKLKHRAITEEKNFYESTATPYLKSIYFLHRAFSNILN